ncbi:MAG: hypothetical protein WD336_09785 [Trueperaceae bacterium]
MNHDATHATGHGPNGEKHAVSITRLCLRSGTLQLPFALAGRLPAGELLAHDTEADAPLELWSEPPRHLSGLGPVYDRHDLQVNDQLTLELRGNDLRIGVSKRPRRSRPKVQPSTWDSHRDDPSTTTEASRSDAPTAPTVPTPASNVAGDDGPRDAAERSGSEEDRSPAPPHGTPSHVTDPYGPKSYGPESYGPESYGPAPHGGADATPSVSDAHDAGARGDRASFGPPPADAWGDSEASDPWSDVPRAPAVRPKRRDEAHDPLERLEEEDHEGGFGGLMARARGWFGSGPRRTDPEPRIDPGTTTDEAFERPEPRRADEPQRTVPTPRAPTPPAPSPSEPNPRTAIPRSPAPRGPTLHEPTLHEPTLHEPTLHEPASPTRHDRATRDVRAPDEATHTEEPPAEVPPEEIPPEDAPAAPARSAPDDVEPHLERPVAPWRVREARTRAAPARNVDRTAPLDAARTGAASEPEPEPEPEPREPAPEPPERTRRSRREAPREGRFSARGSHEPERIRLGEARPSRASQPKRSDDEVASAPDPLRRRPRPHPGREPVQRALWPDDFADPDADAFDRGYDDDFLRPLIDADQDPAEREPVRGDAAHAPDANEAALEVEAEEGPRPATYYASDDVAKREPQAEARPAVRDAASDGVQVTPDGHDDQDGDLRTRLKRFLSSSDMSLIAKVDVIARRFELDVATAQALLEDIANDPPSGLRLIAIREGAWRIERTGT